MSTDVHRRDSDPAVAAGHSLGGLTLAHLPGDDPRVYSAPFWGFAASGLAEVALPAGGADSGDTIAIGDLKPADECSPGDDGVSPAWLGTMRRAQPSLSPFRPGGAVYCSLSDRVVSTAAIGRRVPADRARLYEGGHEFFASTGREVTLERFCADLETAAAVG